MNTQEALRHIELERGEVMIRITMQKILDANPCADGLERVKSTHGHLPLDQEWSLVEAFKACHLGEVLWSLRCLPEHNNLWRKYAVWCAAQVKHLMVDERIINALKVAWAHSEGEATDAELSAAWAAARAAARAAAWDAAWDAAMDAARAAAMDAAMDAAGDAAGAAWDAAMDAAWDAARGTQKQKLIEILTAGEWVGGNPLEEVE